MSYLCTYLLSTPVLRSTYFFFFNDTATTEIYTLSLHDALPIFFCLAQQSLDDVSNFDIPPDHGHELSLTRSLGNITADRKSTRLNSSHSQISYAVFCLKKKKQNKESTETVEEVHEKYTPD